MVNKQSLDIASNIVAFPFKTYKKCVKGRKWRKKSHVCLLPKDHLKNICFWLHWVFVAECRLSLVAVKRGYSPVAVAGFSLWWHLLWSTGSGAHRLQQLWRAGSVVAVSRLSSLGSIAVAHGLSCSKAYGTFPDQG